VLVIDNGSRVSPAAALRQHGLHANVVSTGVNLGYAGGNNLGVRLALERGDENTAVRELAAVIRTGGTAALHDHAATMAALVTPGAEATLESALARPTARTQSLEGFASAVSTAAL